jgi:hypothetical protein
MYKPRSHAARRGRTGRKATGTHIVRRRVQVHKHHPRRYAGVRGGSSVVHRGATVHKPRPSKTGRTRRFLGRKKHVGPRAKRGTALHRAIKGRHGHRIFKGRKKSLHKRVMHKGLHRTFKGRKYHGRHVKPGQHRRFLGRKASTHKRRISTPKPKAAPISSASYLSMF